MSCTSKYIHKNENDRNVEKIDLLLFGGFCNEPFSHSFIELSVSIVDGDKSDRLQDINENSFAMIVEVEEKEIDLLSNKINVNNINSIGHLINNNCIQLFGYNTFLTAKNERCIVIIGGFNIKQGINKNTNNKNNKKKKNNTIGNGPQQSTSVILYNTKTNEIYAKTGVKSNKNLFV